MTSKKCCLAISTITANSPNHTQHQQTAQTMQTASLNDYFPSYQNNNNNPLLGLGSTVSQQQSSSNVAAIWLNYLKSLNYLSSLAAAQQNMQLLQTHHQQQSFLKKEEEDDIDVDVDEALLPVGGVSHVNTTTTTTTTTTTPPKRNNRCNQYRGSLNDSPHSIGSTGSTSSNEAPLDLSFKSKKVHIRVII